MSDVARLFAGQLARNDAAQAPADQRELVLMFFMKRADQSQQCCRHAGFQAHVAALRPVIWDKALRFQKLAQWGGAFGTLAKARYHQDGDALPLRPFGMRLRMGFAQPFDQSPAFPWKLKPRRLPV